MNRPLLRVVTAAWPSASEPTRGRFIEDLHRALAPRFESEILAPRLDVSDSLHECTEAGTVHRFATPLRGRNVRSAGIGPVGAARYVLSGLRSARSVWGGSRSRGGVVFGHWIVPTGWIAARLARRLDLPLVLYAHGSDVHRYGRRGAGRRMLREALRAAALVFAASEPLAAEVRPHCRAGVPVEVLPIGVSADFVAGDPPPPPPPLRLLFVGDLLRAKGVEEIEAAVSMLLERGLPVTLEWVGASGDLGRAPRVGDVRGPLAPAEVAAAMARAHLLLLPSHAEGTPVVLQEAMAMHLPWAATAVGGIPDLADRCASSTLLPAPHERGEVVEAIVSLCEERLAGSPAVEPVVDSVEELRTSARAARLADAIDALLEGRSP